LVRAFKIWPTEFAFNINLKGRRRKTLLYCLKINNFEEGIHVSLLRITQTTEIKNIFNIYFAFIFSVLIFSISVTLSLFEFRFGDTKN